MAVKKPTDEEIFANLDFAFDGLDQERGKGLRRLETVQAIRHDAATRERSRLAAKYGEEHSKVKKLDERLTYDAGVSKELSVEIERAGIKVPSFDVNTWMVHGRVLNSEGKGMSGLTVSLYDKEKNWVEELGYACTDDRGYYAIRYKVDPKEKSRVAESQELFLTVTDSQFKVLHRETEPVFVVIGQIDFRLIVMKDEGGICPPPEPGDDQTGGVPPDAWLVRGTVVYENGEPGKNLIVSLYDKDLFFDDALGTVPTDDAGRFIVMYRTEAFRDLFEKRPDLYVEVLNDDGETLYRSRKKVHPEAGRVEEIPITIKSRRSRSSK